MWDQGHGVARDVEDSVVEGPERHSEDNVVGVLGIAFKRVVALASPGALFGWVFE